MANPMTFFDNGSNSISPPITFLDFLRALRALRGQPALDLALTLSFLRIFVRFVVSPPLTLTLTLPSPFSVYSVTSVVSRP